MRQNSNGPPPQGAGPCPPYGGIIQSRALWARMFTHNEKSQAEIDLPFGINFLYKQWKKVCKQFGIEDLDLYGATRHSSTTAIAMVAGKKQARNFSGHETNKAFHRYCQIADDDSFDMTQLMAKMRGKIIDFKIVKGEEK